MNENLVFELESWLKRIPLDKSAECFSGEVVTSPQHLCQNEHLRRELSSFFAWGDPVPADVFVMGQGSGPRSNGTKFGGTPWRPIGAAWPLLEGKPMAFLAQVNLCDSMDIIGPVPGDVLLLFCQDQGGCTVYSDSVFHVEWQPRFLQTPMSSIAIPHTTSQFSACHGYICRTVNWPDAELRGLTEAEELTGKPLLDGKEVQGHWRIPMYQATQVCSVPAPIQAGDVDLKGRLVATISTPKPTKYKPWPWVNHEDPLCPRGQFPPDDQYPRIGDMGCLFVTIDERDCTHITMSSY